MSTRKLHIFKAGRHKAMDGRTVSFGMGQVADVAAVYDPALSEAPVVVGHPTLNAPAFGWVRGLEAEGGDLFAKVDQLDPAFAEAVNGGAYKKISASFYAPRSANNPVPDHYYLRHVGFLGAAAPAVKGLEAVQFSDAGEGDLVTVAFDFADISGWTIADVGRVFVDLFAFLKSKFDPAEVDAAIPTDIASNLIEAGAYKEGEEDAKAASSPEAAFSEPIIARTGAATPDNLEREDIMSGKKTDDDLKAREAALERKEAAFAERAARDEAEAFIRPLVEEGKVLAVEREKLVSLMAGLSRDETVSFADGEKETSQIAIFRDFLAALPARVDFSERTGGGGDIGDDPEAIAEAAGKIVADAAAAGKELSFAEAVARATGQ